MARMRTKNLFETDEQTDDSNHVIRVAFDSGADCVFDYAVPDVLWPISPGCRVEVPFGRSNKHQVGFCIGVIEREQSFEGKGKGRLKAVKKVIENSPLLDEK